MHTFHVIKYPTVWFLITEYAFKWINKLIKLEKCSRSNLPVFFFTIYAAIGKGESVHPSPIIF